MSAPTLESVTVLAQVRPTPDLIEEAAAAVVESWYARDNDSVEAAHLYRETFDAIAALPPLTACALGVEIRRRLMIFIPEVVRAGEKPWSEVVSIRHAMEERFFRALVLRAASAPEVRT